MELGTAPSGPVVECLPGVQEVTGSISGWVIPKTSKMVFGAFLQTAWYLKVSQGNMVSLPVIDW